MKLSRSVSWRIFSIDWPVWVARILFRRSRGVEDLARVDLDVGGLALEAAERLVNHDARMRQAEALAFAPPASSTAPMLAACPTQIVLMSGLTNCMVS